MYGGAKYSASDLIAGPKDPSGEGRRLANGAMAGYVKGPEGNPVWRILSGASGDYLRSIGPKKGSTRSYRALSPRAARMAFNRHYKNRKGSPRGNQQARTYDLNHSGNVVADSRYRRSPNKYDYRGVDTGSKPNRKMSGAQLSAAQNRIAKARMAKGLRGESQAGGADDCSFNSGTMRCSKSGDSHPEWCEVGPKGRCRKSASGKEQSPKNPKNVARGKALSGRSVSPQRPRRAATQGWEIHDAAMVTGPVPSPVRRSPGRPSRLNRVTGHNSPLMGSRGSACVGLVEADCEKHPACDYRVHGKGKSASCGRKRQSSKRAYVANPGAGGESMAGGVSEYL